MSHVARAGPPERPILLLGCPRSGTTVLLQALLRSPELRSVQTEGHILWDEFHPKPRDSDALDRSDVVDREREYVNLAVRIFARGRRFIDKTPENCLRVPYLDELFPDATFVFLTRKAADNVNSLIGGWRARPRFVTHRLPDPLEGIAPLDGRLWSFALVPGWRELRRASLEEICARQYVDCNEAVLAARAQLPLERWLTVKYEDMVASPLDVLRGLFDDLGVAWHEGAETFARELHARPSRTALTAPRPDKWRRENPEAIERILPLTEGTERRLGYAAGA